MILPMLPYTDASTDSITRSVGRRYRSE